MNEKKSAMATARPSAFARKALVPRVVSAFGGHLWPQTQQTKILDFGCGGQQVHVGILRELGLDVIGHDFSCPDPEALQRRYDVVYASNVLNVQSSVGMLLDTLHEIAGLLNTHGTFIANFPQAPRYCGITVADLLEQVESIFKGRVHVFGAGNMPRVVPPLGGGDPTPCGSPSRSPVFYVRKFLL